MGQQLFGYAVLSATNNEKLDSSPMTSFTSQWRLVSSLHEATPARIASTFRVTRTTVFGIGIGAEYTTAALSSWKRCENHDHPIFIASMQSPWRYIHYCTINWTLYSWVWQKSTQSRWRWMLHAVFLSAKAWQANGYDWRWTWRVFFSKLHLGSWEWFDSTFHPEGNYQAWQ